MVNLRTYVLLCVAILASDVAARCSTKTRRIPLTCRSLARFASIPPSATLEATGSFGGRSRPIGSTVSSGGEREIDQTNFGLENAGVGSFAWSVFTSSTTQGGVTKVQDLPGTMSGSAQLTVLYGIGGCAAGQWHADPDRSRTEVPGHPQASRAPQIVYPNGGAMLPAEHPAARRFTPKPGAAQNTLFQLSFCQRPRRGDVPPRAGAAGGRWLHLARPGDVCVSGQLECRQ